MVKTTSERSFGRAWRSSYSAGVKWSFWPIIVCQLFCFSEWRNKIWWLLFDMCCV